MGLNNYLILQYAKLIFGLGQARRFPQPWFTSQRERMLAYSRTGGSLRCWSDTQRCRGDLLGTLGTRQSRRLIVWAGGFAEGRARYVATSSTSHSRHFPPPWSVEEQSACFVVRDHNGQQLAYVYFEDEPGEDRRPNYWSGTRQDGLRQISPRCRSLLGRHND